MGALLNRIELSGFISIQKLRHVGFPQTSGGFFVPAISAYAICTRLLKFQSRLDSPETQILSIDKVLTCKVTPVCRHDDPNVTALCRHFVPLLVHTRSNKGLLIVANREN